MGFQKIQEKRKELMAGIGLRREYVDLASKMAKELDIINNEALRVYDQIEKLQVELSKKIDDAEKRKAALVPAIKKLDTLKIKEFDDYKKNLLELCDVEGHLHKQLPTKPLENIVDQYQRDFNKMMSDWVEKLAANMPKEIAKGMSFHFYGQERIYELITDANDAGAFKANYIETDTGKTGSAMITKMEIQKTPKVKFVQT